MDKIEDLMKKQIESIDLKTHTDKKHTPAKISENLLSTSTTELPERDEAIKSCKSACPGADKCSKSGCIYFRDETGRTVVHICSIFEKWKKQEELNEKIKRNIPKKFWDKSLENFEQMTVKEQEALFYSMRFVEHKAWKKGANMIFFGNYGSGKTHLSVGIAKKALEKGETVVFLTSTSLFRDIETVRKTFESVRDVDLLIIDDISVETDYMHIMNPMYETLNYRYESEKGMVITTNADMPGIIKIFGERLFDRIQERAVFYEMLGDSYRKKKRKEYTNWAGDGNGA